MSRSREIESPEQTVLKLGDLLEEFDERLGTRPEPEILTLTEKMGFVSQRERFNKRLAIADTSNYKLIGLNDIAFNPYLLWANAIAHNAGWEQAIISPLYPTFRVRKGYSARFVNYLLCSGYLRSHYGAISYGSVPRKRRATVRDFLDLAIPRQPSLAEQERIVKLLDDADALRKLRNQAEHRATALIPALFHEMFGDPEINSRGWPSATFGEIITSTKLGLVRGAKETDDSLPFPYVRMDAILGDGNLGLAPIKHVNATAIEVEEFSLRAGDFLFNTRNSRELVGKTALFEGGGTYLFNNNIMRIRFNDSIEPRFMIALFQTDFTQRQLEARKSGTTSVVAIYFKNLSNLKVIVPPLTLQKEFAQRVTKIRELETDQATSRTRLEALFQSMLHRAFNGDL
jgi:type I restriction enzyme S subunit